MKGERTRLPSRASRQRHYIRGIKLYSKIPLNIDLIPPQSSGGLGDLGQTSEPFQRASGTATYEARTRQCHQILHFPGKAPLPVKAFKYSDFLPRCMSGRLQLWGPRYLLAANALQPLRPVLESLQRFMALTSCSVDGAPLCRAFSNTVRFPAQVSAKGQYRQLGARALLQDLPSQAEPEKSEQGLSLSRRGGSLKFGSAVSSGNDSTSGGSTGSNRHQRQPEVQCGDATKLPPDICSLSGTVERVLFESSSGFFILRVRPSMIEGCSAPVQTSSRPKGPPFKRAKDSSLITVSGNMGQIHPRLQKMQFQGRWRQHAKHGLQLVCTESQLLQNDPASRAIAEISGQVSGVGKQTAETLVKAFGEDITKVFDSPDAARRLATVKGIGPRSAAKFKASWDAKRGTREAARELAAVGVPSRLAWQVVEEHGATAMATLTKDPYTTLRPLQGYSFRGAESIAEQVGCSPQLPSRAWAAFTSVLQEAAQSDGHSYLPWTKLHHKTLQLLSTSGKPWGDSQELQRAAEQMVANQQMVVEHGEMLAPQQPFQGGLPTQPASPARHAGQQCGGAHGAEGIHVEALLVRHIKGVGPQKAKAMLSKFGDDLIAVLNAPDAARHLVKVAGVGPVLAARFKASWDANAPIPDNLPNHVEAAEVPSSSTSSAFWHPDTHHLDPHLHGWTDISLWNGSSRCYLPDLHAAECRVVSCLARMAATPRQQIVGGEQRIVNWLHKLQKEEGITLTKAQQEAVVLAGRSPILVLTGGPGCGKTFTTRIIYQLWRKMSKTVALCAPTGRAAQRMAEWTGTPAKTIHRLLGFKNKGHGSFPNAGEQEDVGLLQFNANASQPLNPDTCNAMLVDEVSMLDLPLATALLSAISPRDFFQLVLVGDVDQLPPVGPGDLLHSAIQSGAVPVVDLREIFRQAKKSSITTSAHAVNSGHFPDLLRLNPSMFPHPVPGKPLAEVVSSDALWICGENASIQQQVMQTLFGLLEPHGIDLVNDTQVLSPVRQGPASTSSLNAAMQQQLNPSGPQKQEMSKRSYGNGIPQIIRTGDKVLQRANNYDKDVYNGDIGFVDQVSTTDQALTVRFAAPGNQGVRFVSYSARELDELELAWATTVHKAQGGEVPVVVVALSIQYGPILSRRLLYTALTRASKMAVVVGSEQAIRMALHGWRKDARLSTLLPRLQAASTGRAARVIALEKPFQECYSVLTPHVQDLYYGHEFASLTS
ncbi:hypothetical protein WJX74_004093 [Apatococcus lobatus]|uniref:Helix-hairpin-helix DNA-binding motif class 1 domain-containing protein n=1 Tax=Apatococcus lobatus TaxID=904363 RepID=A0AAW1S1Z7_9CHLO